jgi:hypothetical protein
MLILACFQFKYAFHYKNIKKVLEKGITIRPIVGQVNKEREVPLDCDVTVLVLENFQSKYDFY